MLLSHYIISNFLSSDAIHVWSLGLLLLFPQYVCTTVWWKDWLIKLFFHNWLTRLLMYIWNYRCLNIAILSSWSKVDKILKGSLDFIPLPSPSVKIQIMDEKVCLRCKGKTMLSVFNKLLKTKSLLILPSNVLPYYLKYIFPPIIWIFPEGDGIKSRLSS